MEGLSPKSDYRGVWLVCGLLFLASAINYMDRQTLAATSKRIKEEYKLTKADYGALESVFGYAFAAGSLAFGLTVDRVSVRLLYPAVLCAWSLMGVLTSYARNYDELYYCRMLLGVFEGGHWPCALRTTMLLLAPGDRMFGNSVLQSGTSIGAVVTPVAAWLFVTDEAGSWRPLFLGVGIAGLGWVVLWWLATPWIPDVPPELADPAKEPPPRPWWEVFLNRRFWIVASVVISLNITWHLLRAWMQLYLTEGRGYSDQYVWGFSIVYYLATDVGCIVAGFASRRLHEAGLSVFSSRLNVFALCSALCLATFALPWLDAGWQLLAVLTLVGMSTLALFPCYYSWAQEIDPRQQGFVSGLLGTFAWMAVSPLHKQLGQFIDSSGRYDLGLAWAGLPPIIAFAIVWLFWNPSEESAAK